MMGNKRQSTRAQLAWPITVVSDNLTAQGTLQNLSCGGALINIPVELFPTEPIRLAIEIPEYEDVISAKGEVVRSFPVKTEKEAPSFRVGIRFTEISHEDLKHFTGNLAPEWQDNYMEAPIIKPPKNDFTDDCKETPLIKRSENGVADDYKKPLLVNQSGNGFALKALYGLFGLLLVFLMYSFLRPNNYNQGETRSIQSIESRLQLFEERFLKMEQNEIPPQHLEERIKRIQDQLTELENKYTASTTRNEPQDPQEKKGAELAEETKIEPKIQTAPPAHVVPEKTPPGYHIVRNGENLYRIGLKYGINVEKLLKLNNLPPNASIYHGQKLLIKP